MGNDKQCMKHFIITFCIANFLFPVFGNAQEIDTLMYCDYPDTEAKPPYNNNEILNIIILNQNNEIPDCFAPDARFYYNITILEDGTVAILNLECIVENESCFLTVDDVSQLEKRMPASKNGKNCNQKMRIKTYIHFK